MKTLSSLAALAALLACNVATADEHTGWVYNGMTGMASLDEANLSDSSFGSNSSLGYRWGKFGVEGGMTYFQQFEDELLVGATPIELDTSVDGWTVGMNYNAQLSDKWSVQGRGGLFTWSADGHVFDANTRLEFDESGNDYYAGLSVDYSWSKRSSIGLGYTYFKVGESSINLWGLHSEFRFKPSR